MMGTWFGIKRYILCKRIFNRAYLTCLIMYEYVWHKWNKVKLKKDLPTLTSTWSVDAKILHIYLLLTRCSEKLFDLSFLFYVHTIAAYLNYKDIMMAYRGRKISLSDAKENLIWTPCIRWLFSSFIWKNMSFGRETLLACVSNSFSAYITSSWTFRSLFILLLQSFSHRLVL